MSDPVFIKQIKVNNVDYDLNVLAIQDENGNPKYWSDITSLVQAGFTIEVPWTASDYASSTAPTAEKLAGVPAITVYYNNGASSATGTLDANTAETKRHIYLVYHPEHGGAPDNYDEYVSAGASPNSFWEKIGNTDIDLSDYAKKTEAAKPGTYTTSTPSSNVTSSAGAGTFTTSSDGGQTATGTASIEYDKPESATGSSGGTGTSANTGEAGAFTINGSSFGFSGTTATITAEGNYQPAGTIGGIKTVSDHTHTVNVASDTTTIVTGVDAATGSAGAHTHSVDSHEHANNVTVIETLATSNVNTITSAGSASLTTRNYGFDASSTQIMATPTVVSEVLQWGLLSAGTQDILAYTAPSYTATSVVTGASTTVSVAGAYTAATLTAASAGAHTHSIGSSTDSITYVTGATVSAAGGHTVEGSAFYFTGTTATISVEGSYRPAGSITGSQTVAAHSHSYTAPAAHTHSIGTTTATATGTASVAVAGHTHTVEITGHTHDLGNHTHNVTIPAIENE